jgi:hypothetical protein
MESVTDGSVTVGFIPGKGRVRILQYEGNGYFTVLTKRDERLFVPRHRIIFTKEKEK